MERDTTLDDEISTNSPLKDKNYIGLIYEKYPDVHQTKNLV